MGYSRGKRWDENKIKSEILKVMTLLNIDRIPSSVEIRKVTNSTSLCNAINKRGGFNHWANIMTLGQSECETRVGLSGELKVKDKLEELGYKVEKMSIKHPYDLLVNGNIKIDVKTARKYNSGKEWSSYSFNLEKYNPTCDIYVFICVEDEKYLIIPSKFLKQTQLCITDKKSKYDIYKDRWDYIDKFDSFYKSVI